MEGNLSAYHLYGNFSEKFPSNGTGFCFGHRKQERDFVVSLIFQNTGKFFAFSRLEAWHW